MQQTWWERLQALGGEWGFFDPAPLTEIEDAERALGVRFPDDLRTLLQESDGLSYNGHGVVFSADDIRALNLRARSGVSDWTDEHMSFDSLLFFREDVVTDRLAFPIYVTGEVGCEVVQWDHFTDSRVCTSTLYTYLTWLVQGKVW